MTVPAEPTVVPPDRPRDAGTVVALDVGGTSIKAALVAADGTVQLESRRSTTAELGPDAVIERILGFAADLAAHTPVSAVGIGVPGVVDSRAGIARYASNLGWRDAPLVQLLEDRLGVPVGLGHDVRLGALAESRDGAGRGAASVYFIAIGTGIAAGRVVDGVVDDGASGQPGEVGHLVVRPGGPRCGCGNRGCLEAIASASRIGRAWHERTGQDASALAVAGALAAGDPVAQHIWDDAVAALADALAAVCVLDDPGLIVVGGGLSLAGETLLGPLRPALQQRLTFREAPPVVAGRLGDRAGLLGAAVLARDVLARSRRPLRPESEMR